MEIASWDMFWSSNAQEWEGRGERLISWLKKGWQESFEIQNVPAKSLLR
jgi:hypothetical protein